MCSHITKVESFSAELLESNPIFGLEANKSYGKTIDLDAVLSLINCNSEFQNLKFPKKDHYTAACK